MATTQETEMTKSNGKSTPAKAAAAPVKAPAAVPPTAMPSGTEMRIPLAKVVADDKFNSRKFLPPEAITEMAASLKRDGQLSPVRVSPRTDGRYDLIYGFRRFYAARQLGWETILATVDQSADMDPRLRYTQNLVENEARQDLTTYERAMRYHEMLELKTDKPISQGQLANMTGKSPAYVSRLLSGVKLLHPKLLERWKYDCAKEVETGGTHTSLVNFTTLKELIKYDHDAQLRWLDEQVNGKPEEPEGEEGEGGDGEGPQTDPRTSLRNIRAALIAAEAAKKAAKKTDELAFAEGAIAALQFAIKPRKVSGILTIKDGKVCDPEGKPVVVPKKDK